MYKAFTTSMNGVVFNPFANKGYLDLELALGDRDVDFGLIPEASLTAFNSNHSLYTERLALLGVPADTILKHIQTLQDSPVITVYIDCNGYLIFTDDSAVAAGAPPSKYTTLAHPVTADRANSMVRIMKMAGLDVSYAASNERYLRLTSGAPVWGMVTQSLENILHVRVSETAFWGSTPISIFYGGSADYYKILYIEYISDNYLGPMRVWWTYNSDLKFNHLFKNTELVSLPYQKPPQVDVFADIQSAVINALQVGILPFINSVASTNFTTVAELLAVARSRPQGSSYKKSAVFEVGRMRLVGRPPFTSGVALRFHPSDIVRLADDGVYHVQRAIPTLSIGQERAALETIFRQQLAEAPADSELKVSLQNGLTLLNSGSTPMRSVFYAEPIDLSETVVESDLARVFNAAQAYYKRPGTIMDEDVYPGYTYKQLDEQLKKRKSTNVLTHFLNGGLDQAYIPDQKSPFYRPEQRVVEVVVTMDNTGLIISSIVKCLYDSAEITQSSAEMLILTSDQLPLVYTAAEIVISSDLLAKYLWHVATIAEAKELAGTVAMINHKMLVYDSRLCTVDGYPNINLIDEDSRSNCIMAYGGLQGIGFQIVASLLLDLVPSRSQTIGGVS